MRFLAYRPNQGYLLPPTVESVLGKNHLCFFVRRVVEKLDLSVFESDYGDEGRLAYHPALMVSPSADGYAYALGVTSSRRLEQRVRRQIRKGQQACNAENPNEGAGVELARHECARLERQLAQIPARLERLKKSGLKRRSVTDPDSRFLKERKGFTLGYTVTMAVSEDHLLVEQRVTQEATDSAAKGHAAIPAARIGESGGGNRHRRHRLQPDADVEHDRSRVDQRRKNFRKRQSGCTN